MCTSPNESNGYITQQLKKIKIKNVNIKHNLKQKESKCKTII